MDILKELVAIRKEKRVKQIDLANRLGITQTTLSRYETGKRDIPLSLYVEYLNCIGYEVKHQRK